jgi:vanillate O-demethylase monooxygenase subunit
MWLKNCWYVAAHAHDVTNTLLARRILNEPIIFWRTTEGTVSALKDRCAHRLVPLSAGRVAGDVVECGYHGMAFAGDGRCVAVPGQDGVPASARVRAYPVVERHGLIWVWMGDAGLADDTLVPNIFWMDQPGWAVSKGYHHVRADYRLVGDNLLDLSHESFLHTHTIGDDVVVNTPVKVDVADGMVVRAHRDMPGIEAPPFFALLLGSDEPIDRMQTAVFHPPSTHMTLVRIQPAGQPDRLLDGRAIHLLTPETATSTHYHWGFARSYHLDDIDLTEKVRLATTRTFDEDAVMLALQQEGVDEEPDGPFPRLALRVDAGPVQGRRLLGMLIDREQASGAVLRVADLP